jgi:predicted RNA binding protein YcfA (HicA-like mRNA interferase family)
MRSSVNGRTFPPALHAKDLKRGTLSGIIRQAGITREDFLRLL